MRQTALSSSQLARVGAFNKSISDAEEQMLTTGTWPRGKPLPRFKIDDEFFLGDIFFNGERRVWICRRTLKENGDVATIEAPTLNSITEMLLELQGELTTEHIEAVEANQPDTFEDANAEEADDFLSSYREGREYGRAILHLEKSVTNRMYKQLCAALGGLRLTFTANNLVQAYNSLLDSNDDFYNAVQEGLRLAAQAEAVAEPEVELEPTPVIGDPHANLRAPQFLIDRRAEDSANRKLSTAELKSKLIREGGWQFGISKRS
jgi:hypothetical protein